MHPASFWQVLFLVFFDKKCILGQVLVTFSSFYFFVYFSPVTVKYILVSRVFILHVEATAVVVFKGIGLTNVLLCFLISHVSVHLPAPVKLIYYILLV